MTKFNLFALLFVSLLPISATSQTIPTSQPQEATASCQIFAKYIWFMGLHEKREIPIRTPQKVDDVQECAELAEQQLGKSFTTADPYGGGTTSRAIANHVSFIYLDIDIKVSGAVTPQKE